MDVFLKGSLTAVSPISYTTPEFDRKTKRGEAVKLPTLSGRLFIPASTLRGRLRRMARNLVFEALHEKNPEFRFPFADFNLATLGGVKSASSKKATKDKNEKEDKTVLERVGKARALNPLASLFGAFSPVTLPGRLCVGHAIAIGMANPETGELASGAVLPELVRHARTDDLARSPEAWEMVDDDAASEYAAQAAEARERSGLNKEIQDLDKALRAAKRAKDMVEVASLEERIDDAKARLNGTKAIGLSQQLTYEVIPAGTRMESSIRLTNCSAEEVVLFFNALDRFACNPVVGGRLNHGLGVLKGEWEVQFRERSGGSPVAGGKVSFDGDFHPLKAIGKAQEWLSADLPWDRLDFSADLLKKAA